MTSDLIEEMFEIIAAFDRDVSEHLQNETERADLWEDVDVPMRLFRQAALTLNKNADHIASLEAALAEAREARLWNDGMSVWGDDGEFCIEWRGRAAISVGPEDIGYTVCDGESWLPGKFDISKEPIKAADEINAAIRRAAALSSSKQKDGE